MLLPMCRVSATTTCLEVHATHALAVVAAEAAAATATTTTKTTRWTHMLTPEKAAWAWRPTLGLFQKLRETLMALVDRASATTTCIAMHVAHA